jgi:hypothetical protein
LKTRVLVPLTLLVAAGMGIFALTRTTPEAKSTTIGTEEPTLENASAPKQCAYTWAYKDLPEINTELQAEVQAVIPNAEAHATAYGENCVYEDGSANFSAMETDFYVIIPVDELADNKSLAKVIEQILPIVDGYAPPRVPGPNDGFVEFVFRHGEEQRILRIPIPLGRHLRNQGLHGAELIQALETQ